MLIQHSSKPLDEQTNTKMRTTYSDQPIMTVDSTCLFISSKELQNRQTIIHIGFL